MERVVTLDTPNPYDAQLSALVDTWQRRFNLELQRALDAESERDALKAKLAYISEAERRVSELEDELRIANERGDGWRAKFDADTEALRETREALGRATALLAHFGLSIPEPLLARLPTEEE